MRTVYASLPNKLALRTSGAFAWLGVLEVTPYEDVEEPFARRIEVKLHADTLGHAWDHMDNVKATLELSASVFRAMVKELRREES